MKSKLKFIIPVVLIVVFGGLKMTVLKAAPAKVKPPNVKGEVYVIPTPFLVNIEGGRFAKVSVGLIFEEGHSAVPHAGVGPEVHAASAAAPKPPEGYGLMPQEALVRSIITDVLTGAPADKLSSSEGRHKLAEKIVKRLHKETDTHVHEVFFIDVVVQ